MRTGPAYAGPTRGSGRRGAAHGVDDEVGAALEEQIEQPLRSQQAGGTPEQGDEARLVQAHGTGGCFSCSFLVGSTIDVGA